MILQELQPAKHGVDEVDSTSATLSRCPHASQNIKARVYLSLGIVFARRIRMPQAEDLVRRTGNRRRLFHRQGGKRMNAVGVVVILDIDNLVKYFGVFFHQWRLFSGGRRLRSSKSQGQPVHGRQRTTTGVEVRAPAVVTTVFFGASPVVLAAFDDPWKAVFVVVVGERFQVFLDREIRTAVVKSRHDATRLFAPDCGVPAGHPRQRKGHLGKTRRFR